MAEMFHFTVDGPPVAQPRHQVQIRWKGTNAYPHHFVPADHPVHAYKQAVSLQARVARPTGWDLDGPFHVHLTFYMTRPPSKPEAFWHTEAGDADNMAKAVLDSLKSIAWNDDRQICILTAIKRYAEKFDGKPRTAVVISRMEDREE